MAGALAYHTVVNALEGRSGWTPISRFAASVTHAINGHLSHHRYHVAGKARKRAGAGEAAVERDVRDWLTTDLNPVVQAVRSTKDTSRVIEGYNAYNASVQLGVQTQVATLKKGQTDNTLIVVARRPVTIEEDPELCRLGTVVVLHYLLDGVQENERRGQTGAVISLVDVASQLGVAHSAAAEVAQIFESEGPMPVAELARKLGCHPRTLERRLREEGITAEALRQASRLIRVTRRLQSSDSLTAIAVEEGFSDQAHMTRSFRFSCGMTPSLLRKVVQGRFGGAD
jgi:AraC-like DNA-binding protein